jgi:thioredoxin 1/putative thioredoxin
MPVPYVTEQEFEQEVLRSELPVLVHFTANWCQPCKISAPEVEAVAQDLEGKLKVFKVDIDQSKRLASMFRIQSVPTFMVVHKGRPVTGGQGVMRRAQILEMVDPYLPRAAGAIKPAELAQLVTEQQAVPVDTREPAAFGRAHIPGAVNIPLEEIENRLAELHMLAGEPVLYCRSGDKTKQMSEKLAAGGMPVAFLEGGFLSWEGSLLPVERP